MQAPYYRNDNFNYWIGLNALKVRGTYRWSDGSAYQYSHFPLNAPEFVPELEKYTLYTQGRCVYFYTIYKYNYTTNAYQSYGYWYYDNCNGVHRYICAKSLNTSVSPSPTPVPEGNCPSGLI
jgi:hypothetical protein